MFALAAFTTGLLFALRVSASALTTTIAANDKSCFYAAVDTAGEKVSVPARVLYSCRGWRRLHLPFGLCIA